MATSTIFIEEKRGEKEGSSLLILNLGRVKDGEIPSLFARFFFFFFRPD